MPRVRPFTDEQLRALINLRPRYDALVDAERGLARMPYNLVRKRVGGREYLYEAVDRLNNGKSLGPMSPALEQRLADYQTRKRDLQHRRSTAQGLVRESGRLAKALRLPMLSSEAGRLLRELDRRELLDETLLVIGTTCLPPYSLEAAGTISDAPDETEDLDLAWVAEQPAAGSALWTALKAVDSTLAVNTERDFQARNASAYEVELLVAPSRLASVSIEDRPRPIPSPQQEWLLLGRRVDQVVPCRDGSAARVVVPDARWFALHKLWLSEQDDRHPLKRRKDRAQGLGVLDAVAEAMPHYPLDAAFVAEIPPELTGVWQQWLAQREPR